MYTALTIAGSDSGGGAGIQADLKTMTVHGVYGMSAVTALTAQNTTGVYGIEAVSPAFLQKQLECIFTDIRPDAVKIGMLYSKALMEVTAHMLHRYHAAHVVLDPVMISTSGHHLIEADAAAYLAEILFPLAELITPNLPEAEALSGRRITSAQEMEQAAESIAEQSHTAVLIKGGHRTDCADDFLYIHGADHAEKIWLRNPRIKNPNTHGTGCTLSSAIAANLAKSFTLEQAVRNAKQYLTGAIAANLNLGSGSGPLNHMYQLHV